MVQETLDWYLGKLDDYFDNIYDLLIDKNYNRDTISIFSQPYLYVMNINEHTAKLRNKKEREKYKEKIQNAIKRFDNIFNENRLAYAQLVSYDLLLSLSRYNSNVRLNYWMIQKDEPDWGDYSDGGFSDYTLGLREYVEEIILGIELLVHNQFYPWLPMFREELKRNDERTKIIIKSATTHYAKIDAIKLPHDYLEWFSKPYWWRELELEVFNEVKKIDK